MKDNLFKQIISDQRIPLGHMICEFGSRGIAKIMEAAGADFVVIDMEHTGYHAADIANLMAWFKATSIAPFVRIPEIQYHFIARTLDAGALGIMAPNVKNRAEAQTLVDAAKYSPLGKRGVMVGAASTDFLSVAAKQYLEYSNENTTLICQIESVEGLENIEEIAQTSGIDVLWVGHFDLSTSMGIPAQFHHDEFLDALHKVVAVAKQSGRAAAIQPGNLEQAREWIELGFNVISFGTDFRIYLEALSRSLREVRQLAESKR